MFNNWNINLHESYTSIILNPEICNTSLHLLDCSKQYMSLLEKIVYDIAMFHFERLNITYDKNKYYVEFCVKNNININQFYLDYDLTNKTGDKSPPLVSCITYLNDTFSPTIVTNITDEMYKYKKLDDMGISYIFPKTLKHISFDEGKYYHGVFDNIITEKKIIVVNLWNKIPTKRPYYVDNSAAHNCLEKIVNLTESKNTKIIILDELTFNDDYFESLLYNPSPEIFSKLTDLIPEEDKRLVELFNFKRKPLHNIELKKNEFSLTKKIDFSLPKFIQRIIKETFYQREVCEWIINECDNYASLNGGWNAFRHKSYSNSVLTINNIQNVFNFIIVSFKYIAEIIKTTYCLDDKCIFNINNLFIVKYEEGQQNNIELHNECCLTVNILLSDPQDFQGGGASFEDGITSIIKRGDMIIHKSNITHTNVTIKGTRYVLMIFMQIYKDV